MIYFHQQMNIRNNAIIKQICQKDQIQQFIQLETGDYKSGLIHLLSGLKLINI